MTEKPILQQLSIGSWIQLGHPAVAEIMASAGFDWLAIDLEHSTITLREAEDLIRVIDLKGVVPLVRLASNNAEQIKRIMDAGAHGGAKNERAGEPSAAAVAKAPAVVQQLVDGRIAETHELELRHRAQAFRRHAYRHAGDHRFGERRGEHAPVSEAL